MISKCSVVEDVVVPMSFNGQRKIHKKSQILFTKSLEIYSIKKPLQESFHLNGNNRRFCGQI